MTDPQSGDPIAEASAALRKQIAAVRESLNADRREVERQEREKEEERKRARREYMRERYAKNREQIRAYQKEYARKFRETDPEKYREQRNAAARRYYAKHREKITADLRDKYRLNKDEIRAKRRQKYTGPTERSRAEARERYAGRGEQAAEVRRRWEAREKRRREVGLPTSRLHRTTAQERYANRVAADEFFSRSRTKEQVAEIRRSAATSRHEWKLWLRDCERARALHLLATQREELERLTTELAKIRPDGVPKSPRARRQAARDAAREAEEARLDAIGKQVNDRLRHTETPRRAARPDAPGPHPQLTHPAHPGMNR